MRDRGKDLNVEMDKAAESSTVKSVSRKSGTGKPVYSSPAKNLRAAAAAKAELSHLTGDAWRKQAERVNELVDICNKQNEANRRANPDAGGSRVVVSARAVTQKSRGQASSPRNLETHLSCYYFVTKISYPAAPSITRVWPLRLLDPL